MRETGILSEIPSGRLGGRGRLKVRAWRLAPLCVLVFSGLAHAESVVIPVVWVSTVDSEGVSGTVESFAPDSRLVLKTQGPSREIPATDVIRIDLMDWLAESDANTVLWTTVDGDAIRGRIAGGSDRSVTLRRKDLGDVEFPLTQLRQIALPSAVRIEPTSTAPSGKDDEILLANGDRLVGLVERIDPNGLSVETSNGRIVLPFDVLRLVRLVATDRLAATSSTRPAVRARLTLRDGSTLTVSALQWNRDELRFRIRGAQGDTEYRLRIEQIVRLEVVGGRWQGLDALTPEVAEHTPLLDVRWPYRVGRNVLGGPLRVGGRSYERGLGVHSRFRLVYDVPQGSERFVTGYALDDDSGDWGHVAVRILVDGRVVHEAPDVRKDGQLRHASVDLKGARRLELFVDFGKNGDVQDRLDWIEPGIVRVRQ